MGRLLPRRAETAFLKVNLKYGMKKMMKMTSLAPSNIVKWMFAPDPPPPLFGAVVFNNAQNYLSGYICAHY